MTPPHLALVHCLSLESAQPNREMADGDSRRIIEEGLAGLRATPSTSLPGYYGPSSSNCSLLQTVRNRLPDRIDDDRRRVEAGDPLHDEGLHVFAEICFCYFSVRRRSGRLITRKRKSVYPQHSVMNNTKWDELRLAMHALDRRPLWRYKDVNGHYSGYHREWFLHFRSGDYASILYVDITADDPAHREAIRDALKAIHLPGEETESGFRVFGYGQKGQTLEYL